MSRMCTIEEHTCLPLGLLLVRYLNSKVCHVHSPFSHCVSSCSSSFFESNLSSILPRSSTPITNREPVKSNLLHHQKTLRLRTPAAVSRGVLFSPTKSGFGDSSSTRSAALVASAAVNTPAIARNPGRIQKVLVRGMSRRTEKKR